MKKYLFTILIAIFAEISFSQTNVYHPFPELNAEWNVSQFGSGVCKRIKYILNGSDTVIQSKIYHKITKTEVNYALNSVGACPYNTVINVNTGYAGAIRNDSLTRKVYYVIPNANTDTLMFDFSLNAGDTIRTYFATTCSNRKVNNVDSVLVGMSYRKRWNTTECYSGGENNIVFIEGVGSEFGLIERIPSSSNRIFGSLNCFSKNSQTLYPINSGSNCPLITSINNYNAEIYNQVYINSFNKMIHIKQASNDYTNYLIYSITGSIISKGSIESPDIEINLKEAIDGIYCISLSGKEQQIVRKIILFE